MQALNQFQQTAERGQVAYLNCDSFKMSAVVDSSEAGTLKAGDAVKNRCNLQRYPPRGESSCI